MVLAYSFCNVSLSPLRSEPTHKAEMVSQLLYGERAEILEIHDESWAKVRCEHDGYEGWCKIKQLFTISKKDYAKGPKFLSVGLKDKLELEVGNIWLSTGSDIFGLKECDAKFKGKRKRTEELECSKSALINAAKCFLNTPYLWGGRSIMGIDCSGLVQISFKLCGMSLPRDAYQQAEHGHTVDFLQHAHAGDLAFFDNAEGHINHVGILVDNHNIIHATDTSGRVVIDRIDQGGIISKSLRQRTHNLRVVTRLL